MGRSRRQGSFAALQQSSAGSRSSSAAGQLLPVVVTFRFQETEPAPIRLSGRFTAANLGLALEGPGQELPLAMSAGEQTPGRHDMPMDFAVKVSYGPFITVTLQALPFLEICTCAQVR